MSVEVPRGVQCVLTLGMALEQPDQAASAKGSVEALPVFLQILLNPSPSPVGWLPLLNPRAAPGPGNLCCFPATLWEAV